MSTNWGVNGVIVIFCSGCSHRHLFINSSLPFEWIFQLKRNKAFVFWQRLPIDWMIHSLAGQTDGQTENNLGLLPACIELWHECHATNKWHVFLKYMRYSFTVAGDAVSVNTARNRGLKRNPGRALCWRLSLPQPMKRSFCRGGELPHSDSWYLCLVGRNTWPPLCEACITGKKQIVWKWKSVTHSNFHFYLRHSYTFSSVSLVFALLLLA